MGGGVSVSGGGPAWNTPESPSRARLLAPQSRAAAENGSDRSQDENSEAAEGGRARGALLGWGGRVSAPHALQAAHGCCSPGTWAPRGRQGLRLR